MPQPQKSSQIQTNRKEKDGKKNRLNSFSAVSSEEQYQKKTYKLHKEHYFHDLELFLMKPL